MEHKCLNCGTEMIVHNDIKLDRIDNPYVGQILFECQNADNTEKQHMRLQVYSRHGIK